MDWASVAGGAIGSAVGFGVVGLLARNWIAVRLSQSVRHEYDSKLEQLRRDMAIRDRAALVAELIAEWGSNPEDRKHLNRLSYEAFLWLPSDIARDLSMCFSKQEGAPTAKEIVGKVRKHLLGSNTSRRARRIPLTSSSDSASKNRAASRIAGRS